MTDENQVDELLREASELPDGPVKFSLTQEAVRAADQTGDEELMFEARLELVSAANFSGAEENMFPAFSWCLNKYKSDPGQFAHFEHTLSWQFKWILSNGMEFPQISLGQIEELFAEMKDFYKRHNYGMREVLSLRSDWEAHRGNKELAVDLHHRARQEPRDTMTDCRACERNADCWFYRYVDDHQRAIAHAEPLLQRQMTCATVPATTFTTMLESYIKTNKLERADQMQATGYRLIRSNPNFLDRIGDQLSYLSFRGKLQAGVNMFARHLHWALACNVPGDRFEFLLGAKRIFEKLESSAQSGRKKTRKLNLPKAFPLYNERHEYDISETLQWIIAEGTAIAKRFDARNQTSAFMERWAEEYP